MIVAGGKGTPCPCNGGNLLAPGLALLHCRHIALLGGLNDLIALLDGDRPDPVHRPIERALPGVCYPRRSVYHFGAPLPTISPPNKNLSIQTVFYRYFDEITIEKRYFTRKILYPTMTCVYIGSGIVFFTRKHRAPRSPLPRGSLVITVPDRGDIFSCSQMEIVDRLPDGLPE